MSVFSVSQGRPLQPRDNKTAIELFIAGVRGWGGSVKTISGHIWGWERMTIDGRSRDARGGHQTEDNRSSRRGPVHSIGWLCGDWGRSSLHDGEPEFLFGRGSRLRMAAETRRSQSWSASAPSAASDAIKASTVRRPSEAGNHLGRAGGKPTSARSSSDISAESSKNVEINLTPTCRAITSRRSTCSGRLRPYISPSLAGSNSAGKSWNPDLLSSIVACVDIQNLLPVRPLLDDQAHLPGSPGSR